MEEPDASIPGPPVPLEATILALVDLTEHLDGVRSLTEASAAVAEFAVDHLGADLAGVFLNDTQGRPARLAASDDLIVELDAFEVATSQGPGTARLDDGAVVTVADTRVDRRWKDWSPAAAERGVLSVCVLGMPAVRGRPVTLQLFSRRADAFAPAHQDGTAARAVAKHAGLALRHIDRLANLAEAMVTRDLIGQAQGIIMERFDLTSEQAMQFLRRSSQHSNEKVRDIAHRVVARSPDAADPTDDP